MFSSNDDKLTKMLNLRDEYIHRVEKNVEKLTKQLTFLNDLNEQIGGAAKKKTAKGAASPAKGAAKTASPAKGAAADKKGTTAGTPPKEETADSGIDLVQMQIDAALNEAQLNKATKALGGDTAQKLEKLQTEVKKALEGADTKEKVKEIVEKLDNMTIPTVSSVPKDDMQALRDAAKAYAEAPKDKTTGKAIDTKVEDAWKTAQEKARAAAAKAAMGAATPKMGKR